jgi:hypothetical protein
MIYALDSDIISYMIKGNKEIQAKFDNIAENGDDCAIPPSVYTVVNVQSIDILYHKKQVLSIDFTNNLIFYRFSF